MVHTIMKNAKFVIYFLAFSSFFNFFAQKNMDKEYFDQHLDCRAPKCWLKCTTSHEPGTILSSIRL